MIQMTVMLGSIQIPQPTGCWRRYDDGGWAEIYTPKRTLDQAGRVVSETECEPLTRLYGDDAEIRRMILMTGGRLT